MATGIKFKQQRPVLRNLRKPFREAGLALRGPPASSAILSDFISLPRKSWRHPTGQELGVCVQILNPQSGRPSLCPGRPLIPKLNSRWCWAHCLLNPFPTSLGLATEPKYSHTPKEGSKCPHYWLHGPRKIVSKVRFLTEDSFLAQLSPKPSMFAMDGPV